MASNLLPSITTTQIREIILSFSCCYLLFLMPSYAETDTISQGQVMRYIDKLVSANKIFRLEFFRPGTSHNIYLGIFPNKETTPGDYNRPVWVANRDTPVPKPFTMPFAMLGIDESDGLLKIFYGHDGSGSGSGSGSVTISNTVTGTNNTSATILDNGNFVLRALNPDGAINRTLWQSFDYPTDTLLPGMKLGINFRTGHNWSLTSWISNQVPASGSFTLGGDLNGSSQLMIWWRGNAYWTSGLWNKDNFNNTFIPVDFHDGLNFTYISNKNEKYLTYAIKGNISWAKVSILLNGVVETRVPFAPISSSVCSLSRNIGTPGCLMELLPKCRKDYNLQFHGREGSIVGSGYRYDQDEKMSLFDCELKCKQHCACIAFASLKKDGTGCEMFDKYISFTSPGETRSIWQEELTVDRVIYFLDTGKDKHIHKKWWIWLAAATAGTLLTLSIICLLVRRYFGGKGVAGKTLLHELEGATITPRQDSAMNDKIDKKMNQVYLFSFKALQMATDSFSTTNKLGEGGFGPVYKGKLPSGQEIAIKRLSRSSGQGLFEFKNEILLIAKLQHDNLVKLLGCCMTRQEKILVYEYLPNRSLDFFLFDSCRRVLLNWTNRMSIIEGVAQGLLYLHRYSRLRVIHRDLKASNILLDQNMNPKISDFGMARIFEKQESEANTNRIVGTYGYMSPEYAIKGVFSTKSDVFSFGVLLLETVSGKKNHGSYHSERLLNLIGLAWELWIEGKAMELTDPSLDGSNHKNEIIRCINVGLLCVQDDAMDRPSMTEVISMLTNESLQLPEPKQPAFFVGSLSTGKDNEKQVPLETSCTNGLSISDIAGR
ncbi:Serine/threonine protein kinase [Handroanthus impetiginosus]|uniref:Receptor-like serine/threonine-protein kinase n=1 Tax=Handroanthus impetiginosus TaxID=429701 RepID=A0A2G9G5N8_9LAMI|nr:Serine/threonine protein kinase [Handroanthus impetiginosus]